MKCFNDQRATAPIGDTAAPLDRNSAVPWLTTAEAARDLKCSESLIRKLCRQGKLPHRRLSERVIRIPAWAVAADATRDR